jgi:hypothetical protein
VSAPLSVNSFPYPDLSLALLSPVCECPSLCRCIPCPDISLPLWFLESGCSFPGHFPCPDLSHPSAVSRKWVPLARLLSFHVLTCPFLCGPQEVRAPRSISFRILTLFLLLPSPGSKHPFNFLLCFRHANVFLPVCIFPESEPFFCIYLLPVFSLLRFFSSQQLFDKIRSLNSGVLCYFF